MFLIEPFKIQHYNTVESFNFVLVNFRGLWGVFLHIRWDVISWMRQLLVLDGKLNLL